LFVTNRVVGNVANSMIDVLGGEAALAEDADGNHNGTITMGDNIGGTGKSTIDEAIRHVDTVANAGWNVADANGNTNNVGPNGKVTFNGDSNLTVTESGEDDDAAITVALNRDLNLDSVTTGNSVLNTDGLTVKDAAGNSTIVAAGGTTVTNGTQTTTTGAN